MPEPAQIQGAIRRRNEVCRPTRCEGAVRSRSEFREGRQHARQRRVRRQRLHAHRDEPHHDGRHDQRRDGPRHERVRQARRVDRHQSPRRRVARAHRPGRAKRSRASRRRIRSICRSRARRPTPTVDGYYSSTGNLTTEDRAPLGGDRAQGRRGGRKRSPPGSSTCFAGSQAVANSKGLFAYDARTGVASTLTVRTPDGSSSGWAGDEGADWTTIESERIADDAVREVPDVARQDGARTGQVRGGARADGRRHADVADDGRVRRARGRRGPLVLLEARRRHACRREALRRARHDHQRPGDQERRNQRRSPASASPSAREVGRERRAQEPLVFALLGEPQAGRAAAVDVQLDHVRRRRQRRGHDRVGEARRADHAASGTSARSIRACSRRPVSRATARF